MKTLPVGLVPLVAGARLARPDQRLEGALQVLRVRGALLVQDDQVDGELLQPPVLVRAQELAHDLQVLRLVDADEHDREVARDAVRPERRRAAAVALETSGDGAQRSGPSRGCGWPGAGRGGPRRRSMPRWWSCTCACVQASVAARSKVAGVAVLVGEVERLLARRRDQRREDRRARSPRAARRTRRRRLKIGSSTGPDRVRQRPAVDDRAPASRISRPRPRKRARSVSYCDAADRLALDRDDVRRPDRRLARRARPARREQRVELGHELGLDEEVREGRVGGVGRGRGAARSRRTRSARSSRGREPEVRDRDPPDLGVVLGRDDDLERRRDRAVAAVELGAVLARRRPRSCPASTPLGW